MSLYILISRPCVRLEERRRCCRFVLIDRHPTRCIPWFEIVHVDTARILLLDIDRLLEKVGLETALEVVHAYECIGDGADNQHDGYHSKCCQTLSYRHVECSVAGLVDTEELENEVRQAAKVEYDDGPGARLTLVPSEVSRKQEDQDRGGHRGHRQPHLDIGLASDNDDELYCEAEEEEEIELQQRDINLHLVSITATGDLGISE